MEINIDVSKIVAETLKNYPSCAHLQQKVEAIYKEHYEELKISVTESNRLGGLDEMIISYETPFLKDRDNFLKKDWKRLNLTQYQTLDEEKFEREVRIQYFQQVVNELKALQEFQRRSAKPIIKDNYCCRYTRQIMQDLVSRYNVSQSDVRFFENFFVQHLYTNLDLGNVYRDKTTEDLDFEKLISRIFEVASLFEKDVQEYFFTCIEEDAERENKLRFGETDWHILKKKILERRKLERNVSPAMPEAKKGQQDALPLFDDAIKDPDKLPELFKRLAEMDNAFINEHGKIIGGRRARKHREVMALAQLISRWVKDGHGQFEVYSMLCKKVGLDESGRSDKITNRSGYDDIRLILLAELKDLLK
jgi:hypothetical protein